MLIHNSLCHTFTKKQTEPPVYLQSSEVFEVFQFDWNRTREGVIINSPRNHDEVEDVSIVIIIITTKMMKFTLKTYKDFSFESFLKLDGMIPSSLLL
jgi:hypothetical protein